MAKRKWVPTPPTKTPAAPEAAAEEECSHGVHGPWCREYTKMQDALTRNTNNTNLLFAAVIEYTDASDVFDSIPTEFQYSNERGPYEQDIRRVITARTVLENVLCGFLPERTYTLTPMREQARKKYVAGRDALLFDLNAAKAEIASLSKRLDNAHELLSKAEIARLRALGYPEEEAAKAEPAPPTLEEDTCSNCGRRLYKGTDEELDRERLSRYKGGPFVHDTCASQANAECERVRRAFQDVQRAGLLPRQEKKV